MVGLRLLFALTERLTPGLGPPSQSLGVDPADPAVMRKPPRKKDEEIINRRVVGRVVFSASVIVFGTLFIYATALSDSRISARDQTMVRISSILSFRSRSLTFPALRPSLASSSWTSYLLSKIVGSARH